jgi:hypothetical protein
MQKKSAISLASASTVSFPSEEAPEPPREFLAFVALLSRNFTSSDKMSLVLGSLREMLVKVYGPQAADAYIKKLAGAFVNYRSDFMQGFMG